MVREVRPSPARYAIARYSGLLQRYTAYIVDRDRSQQHPRCAPQTLDRQVVEEEHFGSESQFESLVPVAERSPETSTRRSLSSFLNQHCHHPKMHLLADLGLYDDAFEERQDNVAVSIRRNRFASGSTTTCLPRQAFVPFPFVLPT